MSDNPAGTFCDKCSRPLTRRECCERCAALQAELAERWIPVSEALPEQSEHVLVLHSHGSQEVMTGWNCHPRYRGTEEYWMPLPAPPTGSEI